jgi:hypothetical protein
VVRKFGLRHVKTPGYRALQYPSGIVDERHWNYEAGLTSITPDSSVAAAFYALDMVLHALAADEQQDGCAAISLDKEDDGPALVATDQPNREKVAG